MVAVAVEGRRRRRRPHGDDVARTLRTLRSVQNGNSLLIFLISLRFSISLDFRHGTLIPSTVQAATMSLCTSGKTIMHSRDGWESRTSKHKHYVTRKTLSFESCRRADWIFFQRHSIASYRVPNTRQFFVWKNIRSDTTVLLPVVLRTTTSGSK